MHTDVISEFRNEFFFLSNFYRADFEWRNHTFPTVEHAFVYAKAMHAHGPAMQAVLDYCESPPTEIKGFGRKLDIDVKAWDANKVGYMREIVHAKFSGVDGLAGKLINTGASMLVEGNTWGDKIWGRCNGEGLNLLGSILMEERGYWLWSQKF